MAGTSRCRFCSSEIRWTLDKKYMEEHTRWHRVHGLHHPDCDVVVTRLSKKSGDLPSIAPMPCSCGLDPSIRSADAWPKWDSCNHCFTPVKLALVDLKAESASGWAEGDPIYIHKYPIRPDKPELCNNYSNDYIASTNLRDVGEG